TGMTAPLAGQDTVATLCGIAKTADGSPYHNHRPGGPLPRVLDPAQFTDRLEAFAAYSMAARIPEVLYQEPCYCPCKRSSSHKSLLDCFASTHGRVCVTCRKEVLLCARLVKEG